MLNNDEFENINLVLSKIENTLNRLPRIYAVEKGFVLNYLEVPDPIRFVCKGDGGGYAILFSWDYIEEWKGNIDIMCTFLVEDITHYEIYPNNPMDCYLCTSSGICKI